MQPDTPRRTAYFWLAWVSLLALSSQQGTPDEDYEIVQVTEFVRHGARSSSRNLLGFNLPDNIQPGTLTANGMRMQYELGVQIRKKYPEIFDRDAALTPADIQVYSSPLARCIESAVSQLMGLMPSDKYPYSLTVDSKSKYALPPFGDTDNHHQPSSSPDPSAHKPFALATADKHTDYLFMSSPSTVCPIGFQTALQHKAAQTRELRHLWSPVSDELVALGFDPVSYAAKPEFDLSDICFVYYEVLAYKYYWGKLPDKISEDLFDRLHKLANVDFANYVGIEEFRRAFTHEFGQILLKDWTSYSEGSAGTDDIPGFKVFVGHDPTLFSMSVALGLSSYQCLVEKAKGEQVVACDDIPPYASSWLFELRRHKQSKQYFVQVLYNNRPIGLCPSQTNGSTAKNCALEDIRNLIKDKFLFSSNIHDDLLAFCTKPIATPELKSPETKNSFSAKQMFFVLVLLVVGGAMLVHHFRRRTPISRYTSVNLLDEEAYRSRGFTSPTKRRMIQGGTELLPKKLQSEESA